MRVYVVKTDIEAPGEVAEVTGIEDGSVYWMLAGGTDTTLSNSRSWPFLLITSSFLSMLNFIVKRTSEEVLKLVSAFLNWFC